MTQRAHKPTLAPKPITSLQNERVKSIRALEMRKVRKESGLFVAEGASILITAREHGFVPETLVFQAGTAGSGVARVLVDWALGAGAECLEVTEAVLGKLASKDNPQNMLAVFRQSWTAAPDAAKAASTELWLALEEVRDLGNLYHQFVIEPAPIYKNPKAPKPAKAPAPAKPSAPEGGDEETASE